MPEETQERHAGKERVSVSTKGWKRGERQHVPFGLAEETRDGGAQAVAYASAWVRLEVAAPGTCPSFVDKRRKRRDGRDGRVCFACWTSLHEASASGVHDLRLDMLLKFW